MALTREQALQLLREDANKPRRGGAGTKRNELEVRELPVWFKANHHLREGGCENPECGDPRPTTNSGRNVCVLVNNKWMCRYCFIAGWNV
jgi:hypothetical protein